MKILTKEKALTICSNLDIININFYNPKNKTTKQKIKIRKVLIKNNELYQLEEFKNNQSFHKNIKKENLDKELNELFDLFKEIQVFTKTKDLNFLQNKKGIIRFSEKNNILNKEISLDHDKEKNYIIPIKNIPYFFKELKIFTQEGKLIKSKSNKFKQINKYLEFIETVLPELQNLAKRKGKIQIVDFGCGKAYLSFALYYYLNEMKKIPTEIYGLDLKESVIEFCNNLSKNCKFQKLKFIHGDINNFNFDFNPDMIITLHACDIATDMALAKAIKIETPIIFAVPCCQHEVNKQIKNNIKSISKPMKTLCEYGIINEKLSALLTDTLRAKILEKNSYKVNIEEFIDLEHTPKNILIKAVKDSKNKSKDDVIEIQKEIDQVKDNFKLALSLEKFLRKQ